MDGRAVSVSKGPARVDVKQRTWTRQNSAEKGEAIVEKGAVNTEQGE